MCIYVYKLSSALKKVAECYWNCSTQFVWLFIGAQNVVFFPHYHLRQALSHFKVSRHSVTLLYLERILACVKRNFINGSRTFSYISYPIRHKDWGLKISERSFLTKNAANSPNLIKLFPKMSPNSSRHWACVFHINI